MFWTKDQLLTAIDSNDPALRNYFDTFGFVVIKKLIDAPDYKRLLDEYNAQYETRAGKFTPWKMLINSLGFTGPQKFTLHEVFKTIVKPEGMRFLPIFVDSSKIFCDYFFSDAMIKIYRYFAGENFLYLGSDGSHFIRTSFPWHRDWLTKIQVLKINTYFNPLPFLGGKFMLIPGTNFTGDTYTQLLQKAMAWPMQNKKPGGLSENGFLPDFVNPRRGVFESWLAAFKTALGFEVMQPDVPHISIKISKGDVIIFDQRLIHCVQACLPRFSRRLLTMLLAKNAYDLSNDHYLLKQGYSREQLMREVLDLVISGRNHLGCQAWGEAVGTHSFSQNKHFIRIEKIKTGLPVDECNYNTASFLLAPEHQKGAERFASILDIGHYANIGRAYRESLGTRTQDASDTYAQPYVFGDAHLGVHAQNIKKVSNE